MEVEDESIAACAHNNNKDDNKQNCTYKDDIKQIKATGIGKKDDWTKTRCARPSLTGVGDRDLGWTLLGQGMLALRKFPRACREYLLQL